MNHRKQQLEQDWNHVGAFARDVVAKRAGSLTGAGIILGELVRDGIIPTGLASSITHYATISFGVLGVVTGVLWAQKATTPADPQLSPTDIYGNQLVSALSVGPHAGNSGDTPPTDALAVAETIHPMSATDTPSGGLPNDSPPAVDSVDQTSAPGVAQSTI